MLAIHWYPEARGDGIRVAGNETGAGVVAARLQAPRSLWDPTYKEDSWLIGENGQKPLNILPRVKESIDTWYPGTRIAVTEYSFGAVQHWSGALAMADVLGIFAREGVYVANLHTPPVDFLAQAFKLYRNVDGNFNTFGDKLVPSTNPDSTSYSIYSSLCSRNPDHLHMIVINKKQGALSAQFNLEGSKRYASGLVYGLAAGEASISKKGELQGIQNNTFTYNLPGYSMLHFILSTAAKTELTKPVSYSLKTTAVGNGRIVRSEPMESILAGTEVTLSALPADGWRFAGWSGDIESSNPNLTITMSRNYNLNAVFMSTEELIVNGSFSEGLQGWTVSDWSENGTAKANAVVENGTLKFTVENGGTELWNTQFFQKNIPLVKGVSYTLSFDAWAQRADSITIFLAEQAGFGRIGLTTSKKTFTVNFTMDSATTAQGRLSFDMGGANRQGTFYFDNISLKAAPSTVAAPQDRKSRTSGTGSVSIRGNKLELRSASGGLYTISLYDFQGKCVMPIHKGRLDAGTHMLTLPNLTGSRAYVLKIQTDRGEKVVPLMTQGVRTRSFKQGD